MRASIPASAGASATASGRTELAPGSAAAVSAATLDAVSGIDVLVNNAGPVRAGRLDAIDESEVLAQIALNLIAPILLTRAALPALKASGDGLVVNVSSGIGLIGMPFYTTCAASKAGIAQFGEALRREVYGEGVHVLNVFPGATKTPMMTSSNATSEHGFEYESPDDVAAATIVGMVDGCLNVVRGGEVRASMIGVNHDNPAAVDEALAARKPTLEEAVASHSSL